jgi:predicted 2-oxoglutarate/Fe(II)-dependent dioxygenase YbiX
VIRPARATLGYIAGETRLQRTRMATEPNTKPPFETMVAASNFMSAAEMDRLIEEHSPLLTESKLGAGATNAAVRRSKVAFLGTEPRYRWLYERLWVAAQECNRSFFGVDIATVEANVQLARYDSTDKGFYDWHTDFAQFRPLRKLSFSVQLSRTEDYDGGDLQLWVGNHPQAAIRERGALIAFPSFTLHRVSPVTRGTRWSLVAWILGNRWQ